MSELTYAIKQMVKSMSPEELNKAQIELNPSLFQSIKFMPGHKPRHQSGFEIETPWYARQVWQFLFKTYANELFYLLHLNKDEEAKGFAALSGARLKDICPEALYALSKHPNTKPWFGDFDWIAIESILIRDGLMPALGVRQDG